MRQRVPNPHPTKILQKLRKEIAIFPYFLGRSVVRLTVPFVWAGCRMYFVFETLSRWNLRFHQRDYATFGALLLFTSVVSCVHLLSFVSMYLREPVLLSLAAVLTCSVAIGLSHIGYATFSRVFALLCIDILLFLSCLFDHPNSVAHLFMFTLVGAPFLVLRSRENRSFVFLLAALPMLLWGILFFHGDRNTPFLDLSASEISSLQAKQGLAIFLVILVEFALFDYVANRYAHQLNKALKEQERANRVKSVFLSSMSHELRTPLSAVIGAASFLKDHPDANEEFRDMSKIILTSGENVLRISEKSAIYSRIVSGDTRAVSDTLDPTARAQQVFARLEDEIADKALQVAFDRLCEDPVIGDPLLYDEAVYQVVENAIKFSPQGGTIRFAVTESDPGFLQISIIDQGPGIPHRDFKRAFDPFNRGRASFGTTSGSGIGLTIAKTYVRAQQGNIGVCQLRTSGTRIWIDMPRATLDS